MAVLELIISKLVKRASSSGAKVSFKIWTWSSFGSSPNNAKVDKAMTCSDVEDEVMVKLKRQYCKSGGREENFK